MHERFQCCLVSAVRSGRPEGMSLIERSVVENYFMNSTGGDKDESPDARGKSLVKQLQGAGQIHPLKSTAISVTAPAAVTGPFPLYSRVDDRIDARDQGLRGGFVT